MELFQSRDIADALSKIQPDYLRDDLKAEVFASLLEKPIERIEKLHQDGDLTSYTVRMMYNMIRSTRPDQPFYSKFYVSKTHVPIGAPGCPTDYRDTPSEESIYESIPLDGLPPSDMDPKDYHDHLVNIQRAVDALSHYESSMLAHYIAAGHNAAEVSRITEIPETSVRYVIRKAKEKAKKIFRELNQA